MKKKRTINDIKADESWALGQTAIKLAMVFADIPNAVALSSKTRIALGNHLANTYLKGNLKVKFPKEIDKALIARINDATKVAENVIKKYRQPAIDRLLNLLYAGEN